MRKPPCRKRPEGLVVTDRQPLRYHGADLVHLRSRRQRYHLG